MMHNNVLKKWAELSASAQKEFSKMKNQRQALLVCRFFVIRRFGFFLSPAEKREEMVKHNKCLLETGRLDGDAQDPLISR